MYAAADEADRKHAMYANSGSRISTAKNREQQQLLDEIANLRRRLEVLVMGDDCAYEHAIIKLYQGLVKKREQQLTALQASL